MTQFCVHGSTPLGFFKKSEIYWQPAYELFKKDPVFMVLASQYIIQLAN
jgi:hypothetical protein